MSNIVYSKIDGKRYCRNGQFQNHLNEYGISDYCEYYEMYITGVTTLCGCGKRLTFYGDGRYANSCGDPICVGKNISKTKKEWTISQREQDSYNKRQSHANRSPQEKQKTHQKTHQKTKNTCLSKYGVEYITQSTHFKEKSEQTKMEKYGDVHYANWEQSRKTNKNKSPAEKSIIDKKRRATNQERYNVDYVAPDLSKISASNSLGKDYELPSGTLIKVRGYENIVLAELFRSGHNEKDIVIDSVTRPLIPVFNYINYEHRNCRYYPDIYIPSVNKIIEVKSLWWWDTRGRDGYDGRIYNNLKKKDSVIGEGYEYEVWLFDTPKQYKILRTSNDYGYWENSIKR